MDHQNIPKFAIPVEEKSHGKDLEFEIFDVKPFWNKHSADMMTPHRHSFYQIIWLTKGKGDHYIDFRGYPYNENTLFFVAKEQIHYFDKNIPYGHIMHFNDSFLQTTPGDLDIYLMFDVFNTYGSRPNVEPRGKDLLQFQMLLGLILEEYEKGTQFGRNAVLGYLINSFLILAQRIKERIDNHNNSTRPKHYNFLEFRNLLEKQFKNNLSVRDYAEKLNISPKQLNIICRENVDKTPLKIIRERTILEAKRFMFHSEMNIQQIAFDLGYDDPFYFSRMFKKETGMSPTGFRENLSKNPTQTQIEEEGSALNMGHI